MTTRASEPPDDSANTTPIHDESLTPQESQDELEDIVKPGDDSDSGSDTPEYGDERLQLYKYVDAQQQRIEKQIIFAGLLSILVTMHIFSSRWLRTDSVFPAALLYARIWLGFDTFVNRPINTSSLQSITLPSGSLNLRVTAYLLASVILCLLTVVGGAISLRWWREYLRCLLLPQEVVYDDHFKRKMLMMMSLFPIMLQFSVLLVLASVLELLWEWNEAVAAVVTALVGLVSLIVVPATAVPLVQNLYAVFTTSSASR
ncbi:hypothetical protein F5887DRAFT_1068175 [Amanita rubescens]|nr:hypothetical protein F5887DRAFT_1087577 [Amanita rubescens]KAF8351753.1 hypothetical protein F5887DRAFT_1068175 [Amanita rubescens]